MRQSIFLLLAMIFTCINSFAQSQRDGEPCPGIPTVNYAGVIYNTVQIGSQCWLRENLRVGSMVPGSQEQTDNSLVEKYCYDNILANCTEYGGLYLWDEMMKYDIYSEQGICPVGWHVPRDDEWWTLTYYLGDEMVTGGKMKEAGYTHWNLPNIGATNESGFTALPSGERNTSSSNEFLSLGFNAMFWSSTPILESEVSYHRGITYGYPKIYGNLYGHSIGLSVRCIKND
jgi:uncharacterized protein (TIGR02145 family)